MSNVDIVDPSDISSEVRNFAEELYHYIWSKQIFDKPGNNEHGLKYSPKNEINSSHFTENIGKAVRVSQFLLRAHFSHLLEFTFSRTTFKYEAKLMWTHWLDNREDVFVEVIDTLAIIAEIILFCNSNKNFRYECFEAVDWFVEWFHEELECDFLEFGGWEELEELSTEYADLMSVMDPHMTDTCYYKYEPLIYDCKLIHLLRDSPVLFPVPANAVCDNCREPYDKDNFKNIVYVRLQSEVEEALARESSYLSINDSKPDLTNDFYSEFEEKTEEESSLKIEVSGDPSPIEIRTSTSISGVTDLQTDASIVETSSQFSTSTSVSHRDSKDYNYASQQGYEIVETEECPCGETVDQAKSSSNYKCIIY